MIQIGDIESNLEAIERESAEAVAEKERAEDRESQLRNSINKLADDAQLSRILERHREDSEENRLVAEREVEKLRQRAEELRNELQEMIDEKSESAAVLIALQELGEDVSDSVAILEERQMLIDECTQRLQTILEQLGLNSAELNTGSEKSVNLETGDSGIGEQTDSDDSGSGEGSFRDRIKADTKQVGNCCGVLTFGKLPEGYESAVKARLQSAPRAIRELFNRFSGSLVIQNTENPREDGAYYLPTSYIGSRRGVYYNAEYDMNNERGKGTTYFHELGHMIDHAAGSFQSYLSDSPEFRDALYADAQRVVRLVSQMPKEKKLEFVKKIRLDPAHSCSDLLDGLTGGKIRGRWVHDREYWNDPQNVQLEAFAHFFEAYAGGGTKLKLLRQVFPSTDRVFQKLVLDTAKPTGAGQGEARELER